MLIGIDIGGTKCAVILATDEGEKLYRAERPTTSLSDMLAFFREEAGALAKKHPVRAVGISCGSPLDSGKGIIQSPPNLPGWDDVPICEILTECTGAPAFLCNDANACALAEWQFGAGKGTKNMIFLTFGTGMGAGLILDGRLYEGTSGMAGEVGHIRLAEDGPEGYGKRGSFEGFCSGGGIARLGQAYAEKAAAAGKSVAWAKDKITAKSLAEAAFAGDGDALAVYRTSAEKLGAGISVLMDLFDPERIVIGSVFARSEALFRQVMESVTEKEALAQTRRDCTVVPAILGDEIGDYAAIAVAKMGKL